MCCNLFNKSYVINIKLFPVFPDTTMLYSIYLNTHLCTLVVVFCVDKSLEIELMTLQF